MPADALDRDSNMSSGVKVVCRLRPMNEREKKSGTVPAATASTERKEVSVVRLIGGTRKVSSSFRFDGVLTSFSTQGEVFAATLEPLIGEVLNGFEATAFAYGQTGTGKTYTMEGDVGSDDGRGLVPRAASAVLNALSVGRYSDYSITVSYLEIYNEECSDLLAPPHLQNQKLDLKDGGSAKGIICHGLSENKVSTVSDVLDLVHRAQERRRVAETRINARSSRSHSIFTMKVSCRRAVASGELENVGKLHLVDLAGSECAKKASGSGDGIGAGSAVACNEERERRSINQSLLTLGRVITALRDNSGRIPYRDSKLTRILQESLGGRCKTVIIATISPAPGAVEETISTLTYAEQAAGIQNRPVASSLLRTIRMANGDMLADGSGTPGLGTHNFAELEMKIAYLSQEVEEAQGALARKYKEAQEQAERAACAEEQLLQAQEQLNAAHLSIEEGTYVREQLCDHVKHQNEAATKVFEAYKAAVAHGNDLSGHLTQARSTAFGSKQQAQSVCKRVEADTATLRGTAKNSIHEVVSAVINSQSVHNSTSEIGALAMQDLKGLLGTLLARLRDGNAQISTDFQALVTEATAAFDADEVATAGALDTIEQMTRSISCQAVKAKSDTDAAVAAGVAAVEPRVANLCVALTGTRNGLSTAASGTVSDLAAARAVASQSHEAALGNLETSIRAPLARLSRALADGSRTASDHCSEVTVLQARDTDDSSAATTGQLRLLAALGEALSGHTASYVNRHASVNQANQSLSAALTANREAALDSWMALGERLGQITLGHHTNVDDRDTMSTLASVLTEQHTNGSASTEQATESTLSYMAVLGSALDSLHAAYEQTASNVAELQKQRSAEQEAIELLRRQRESLEANVKQQQDKLLAVDMQLSKARSHMEALQERQAQRRNRMLQAVSELVTSELDGLGTDLVEGSDSVRDCLDNAVHLTAAVDGIATSAQKGTAELGCSAADVVSAWSQRIDTACGAISQAQEQAREGTACVTSSSAAAAKQLSTLGDRFAQLEQEVAAHNALIEEEAAAWRRDGVAHTELLDTLSTLGANLLDESEAKAAGRSDVIRSLADESSNMKGHATLVLSEAETVLQAVVSQANVMPVDFQATDGAFVTTTEAIRKMSGDAETAITSAVEAVTNLGKVHKDTAQSTNDGISRTVDSIVKAANAGGAITAAHRVAAAAEASQSRERWARMEERHQASLVVFEDISGQTETNATDFVRIAQAATQAEVSKGQATRDSAVSRLKHLAESVEAGLLGVQTAVSSGVAGEPLAAFKEDALPVVPERPQGSVLPEGEPLLPGPDVATLAADFHNARSGQDQVFNSAENVGPAGLAAVKDAARQTVKPAIGVQSTEHSVRKVLGELNCGDQAAAPCC